MKVGEKRPLVARVTAAMGFLFGLIGFAMAPADPMPPLHERLPDAGAVVGLTGLPVDHPDVQSRVRLRTERSLSGRPL